ncbi:MAG: AzlD domain-containing protein [Hyphomicrobiales bacterium]|jgi:uncharacterized membrane protein
MSDNEIYALIIIFSVAVGTYGLRLSGLLLSGKISNEGRIRIFLDYLPPTLLLSFVTPAILKEGIAGVFAMLLIAICMHKTKNVFMSMIIGVVTVAISRNFF